MEKFTRWTFCRTKRTEVGKGATPVKFVHSCTDISSFKCRTTWPFFHYSLTGATKAMKYKTEIFPSANEGNGTGLAIWSKKLEVYFQGLAL